MDNELKKQQAITRTKRPYDIDYFINKFTAIPDDKWTTRRYETINDKCCALGHCGERTTKHTIEATTLNDIIANSHIIPPQSKSTTIVYINDGDHNDYKQDTPKARILAALNDIKNNQN